MRRFKHRAIAKIFLATPAFAVIIFFTHVSFALAAKEQFVPRLAIPIPTVKFVPAGDNLPFLGQYIGGIYEYASALAAVLAGVMFVIGGLEYVAGKNAEGKKRIENATIGLFLTLTAYTILNTINFDLAHFKPMPSIAIKKQDFKSLEFKMTTEDEKKKVGEECVEASECKQGLKCEAPKSLADAAKELEAAAVARAKELARAALEAARTKAVAGLEKTRQIAFDAADKSDAMAEEIYKTVMSKVDAGEKEAVTRAGRLPDLVAAPIIAKAKETAEKLRVSATAARDLATEIRTKARALAEEGFKKALEALEPPPPPAAPAASPAEKPAEPAAGDVKKQCTK